MLLELWCGGRGKVYYCRQCCGRAEIGCCSCGGGGGGGGLYYCITRVLLWPPLVLPRPATVSRLSLGLVSSNSSSNNNPHHTAQGHILLMAHKLLCKIHDICPPCLLGLHRIIRPFSRAVDPHSFFADPDPAVCLNAQPDPAAFSMRIWIQL